MKYINLNNTDLKVSAISLGTDVFGSSLDYSVAKQMLDSYINMGGNVLDTAHIYGRLKNGEGQISEKTLGKYLKANGKRHDVIIATKGAHPNPATMDISRLSKEEIISDIDDSLLALDSDYTDIFYLHRDDEKLDAGEIMETLALIVKSGKARYIGVSNWKGYRIAQANEYAHKHNLPPIICSQIMHSAAKVNAEHIDPTLVIMDETEYEFYNETKIAVFAFASQAKGLFSKIDSMGVENLLDPCKLRYLNDTNIKRYEKIKETANNLNISVGQVALAILINDSHFNTIPIVGCKNILQFNDSINACDIILSKDIIDYILK